MSLFVTISKLNALPMRLGQYYLNKDAFDKVASVPGIYEVSDINYLGGDVPTGPYDGKAAAMGKGREHLLDIESPTPLEGEDLEKLPVIVELHGGDIYAESEPGGFTSFRFWIPIEKTTDPQE